MVVSTIRDTSPRSASMVQGVDQDSLIATTVDVVSHCGYKPELIGLPTELVLKIVKHLDFVTLVKARTTCRYMHTIFFAPTFWKTIEYKRSRHRSNLPTSIFHQVITRCGPHIRQINSTEMDESSMELIASHCHNLVELGLLNTTSEMFCILLNAVSRQYHGGRCFEKLRRLDIVAGTKKERGLDSNWTDFTMNIIGQSCPNLQGGLV
ncbi:hypothetical protein HDU76_003805 [Blyttiomyces sp. JEL0837]|nr:hypothetical protein HDU76_003805 [Blyttiomyces sp. JEL0837]